MLRDIVRHLDLVTATFYPMDFLYTYLSYGLTSILPSILSLISTLFTLPKFNLIIPISDKFYYW